MALSFFDKFKRAFGPPEPEPIVSPPRPRHPFDPSGRIWDLTSCDDWIFLRSLYPGISIMGSAGSGKTSSMAQLAYYLMLTRAGFCVMTAKESELNLFLKLAKNAGRLDDVRVLGIGPDGQLTPERFNPISYEASIPTTDSSSLVRYLSACAKVHSHKIGERAPAEGERFWQDQFDRLLLYCIDTAKLAGRPLSIDLLRKIQLSAPRSKAEIGEENWIKTSLCWQCIREAEARLDAGEIAEADFERILSFWVNDFANLDPKPKGAIDVSFAVLVDAFTASEPFRTLLNGETTIRPEEDIIENGRIVILSIPTSIYHNLGRMAQFAFKTSLQRAILRRKPARAGGFLRPVVIWCDEASMFAHAYDSEFFALCRDKACINVYMNQGVGGYLQTLGLNSLAELDHYLQNLNIKVFFQSNSPETNKFAADAIGKLLLNKSSSSFSHSLGGAQIGEHDTPEERHQIITGSFGFLKRGGEANDFIVEGYVLLPETFNLTGTNVAQCKFLQTEVTR